VSHWHGSEYTDGFPHSSSAPFLLTKMLQVPLMTVCRFRFSLIEIASVSGVPIWLANFDSRTGIAVPDLPLFLASKQQYSNSPKMA